jgi:hypothetical protein
MAEWEYLLPTGEKLEAQLDTETLTESVYVGPRLVSRSPPGGKGEGHVVPMTHGDGAGPFRGGSSARVVFEHEPPSCEVSIDGRPLEPTVVPPVAQPPDKPPDAEVVIVREARPTISRALFAILLVAVGVPCVVFLTLRALDRTRAKPALPLVLAKRMPNGSLEVRYSEDFDVTTIDAPSPGRARVVAADPRDRVNVMTLDRRGRDQRVVIVAEPHPTTTDFHELHGLLANAEPQAWRPQDGKVLSLATGTGRCHVPNAVIAESRVDVRGTKLRVWSCTFSVDGKAFRFVTYVHAAEAAEEPMLRRIVESATPL